MSFLASIENSALATWIRESSSLWAYPTILFLHTIGLGFLVGLNAAIDLRILGVARRMPLSPMETFYRVMWAGFWVNALSGTALLIADATTKLTNPVFYIKMGFVTLAVVNMVWIRRRVFRNPDIDRAPVVGLGRALAMTSLFFWAGAITAGRLMAYFGPVSGAPGLQNRIP
jgi:uncharacterized membrane protein